MSPTIEEVLAPANAQDYPEQLRSQAKNLYEAKQAYTSHAEKAVAGIVRDMTVLSITPDEAKSAIGKILDLKSSIDDHADAAFAEIARDFEAPKKAEEPKPTPATPSLPTPSPLPAAGSGTEPVKQPEPSPTPASPATKSQAEIAEEIRKRIEAESKTGAGDTGQGPDQLAKSDGDRPQSTTPGGSGLASPGMSTTASGPSAPAGDIAKA